MDQGCCTGVFIFLLGNHILFPATRKKDNFLFPRTTSKILATNHFLHFFPSILSPCFTFLLHIFLYLSLLFYHIPPFFRFLTPYRTALTPPPPDIFQYFHNVVNFERAAGRAGCSRNQETEHASRHPASFRTVQLKPGEVTYTFHWHSCQDGGHPVSLM